MNLSYAKARRVFLFRDADGTLEWAIVHYTEILPANEPTWLTTIPTEEDLSLASNATLQNVIAYFEIDITARANRPELLKMALKLLEMSER